MLKTSKAMRRFFANSSFEVQTEHFPQHSNRNWKSSSIARRKKNLQFSINFTLMNQTQADFNELGAMSKKPLIQFDAF